MGLFNEILNRNSKTHNKENSAVVRLTDPLGIDAPVKYTLKGLADPTGESVLALVRAQEEDKTRSKQNLGENEEGEVVTNRRVQTRSEVENTILQRRELRKAVISNTVEQWEAKIKAEIAATLEAERLQTAEAERLANEEKAKREEAEKAAKLAQQEAGKSNNRIKDKVGANGSK